MPADPDEENHALSLQAARIERLTRERDALFNLLILAAPHAPAALQQQISETTATIQR